MHKANKSNKKKKKKKKASKDQKREKEPETWRKEKQQSKREEASRLPEGVWLSLIYGRILIEHIISKKLRGREALVLENSEKLRDTGQIFGAFSQLLCSK